MFDAPDASGSILAVLDFARDIDDVHVAANQKVKLVLTGGSVFFDEPVGAIVKFPPAVPSLVIPVGLLLNVGIGSGGRSTLIGSGTRSSKGHIAKPLPGHGSPTEATASVDHVRLRQAFGAEEAVGVSARQSKRLKRILKANLKRRSIKIRNFRSSSSFTGQDSLLSLFSFSERTAFG